MRTFDGSQKVERLLNSSGLAPAARLVFLGSYTEEKDKTVITKCICPVDVADSARADQNLVSLPSDMSNKYYGAARANGAFIHSNSLGSATAYYTYGAAIL